ncbi:MAG: hypothetical protein ACTSQS_18660, partial [Promethearchaeota archaeon]
LQTHRKSESKENFKENLKRKEDVEYSEEKSSNTELWLKQFKNYRKAEELKEEPKKLESESEYIQKDEDIKAEINVAAYFLSKKGFTYNELCWFLAEKQLNIQMRPNKPTEDQIKNKAEVIFSSSSTYDELCWLLAELNVYDEKKFFDEF